MVSAHSPSHLLIAYDNLNGFSNLRFQTKYQHLASQSANSKSLKSIYSVELMALDGPSISHYVHLGPLGGECVIQLPLYKFYYMVLGMAAKVLLSLMKSS